LEPALLLRDENAHGWQIKDLAETLGRFFPSVAYTRALRRRFAGLSRAVTAATIARSAARA
jgi:hypothetical protein